MNATTFFAIKQPSPVFEIQTDSLNRLTLALKQQLVEFVWLHTKQQKKTTPLQTLLLVGDILDMLNRVYDLDRLFSAILGLYFITNTDYVHLLVWKVTSFYTGVMYVFIAFHRSKVVGAIISQSMVMLSLRHELDVPTKDCGTKIVCLHLLIWQMLLSKAAYN